ncbi:MAG: 16S rRNA (guanine(966)-N(2))-methyltransferase RsmD [Pseudomonadota bacterium]
MARGNSGQLRIIGGQWRGRKVPVPTAEGLRPTGDRIRETLFNWLAAQIPDAHCLDLFAGTGALGLEALSRGAAHCAFVEIASRPAAALEGSIRTLNAESRCEILRCSAEEALNRLRNDTPDRSFHVAFLDPPFEKELLSPALEQLCDSGILTHDAVIYVECSMRETLAVPSGWTERRQKRSGEVAYGLLERSA